MDHYFGPAFIAARGRRLGEARIEKAARRRGGEPERMRGVGLLDHLPMIGQYRHRGANFAAVPAPERHRRPVRLEAEFAAGIGETVEIVGLVKIRLAIDPALTLKLGERAPAGLLQTDVD